ncbi:hypothetical protein B9479_006652 [Cryptococcus floricola]|uniref:Uncharacterized protein n=1 Tax=Cryptococcus floricola TaxID=2591691 RepID=A0A5D3APJ6_9TREE|nr:hypothetical protein B9479_006652 [Cryptococcus floricola]
MLMLPTNSAAIHTPSQDLDINVTPAGSLLQTQAYSLPAGASLGLLLVGQGLGLELVGQGQGLGLLTDPHSDGPAISRSSDGRFSEAKATLVEQIELSHAHQFVPPAPASSKSSPHHLHLHALSAVPPLSTAPVDPTLLAQALALSSWATPCS